MTPQVQPALRAQVTDAEHRHELRAEIEPLRAEVLASQNNITLAGFGCMTAGLAFLSFAATRRWADVEAAGSPLLLLTLSNVGTLAANGWFYVGMRPAARRMELLGAGIVLSGVDCGQCSGTRWSPLQRGSSHVE